MEENIVGGKLFFFCSVSRPGPFTVNDAARTGDGVCGVCGVCGVNTVTAVGSNDIY
jgi:hypothetical protein